MDDVHERITQVLELLENSHDEELLLRELDSVLDLVESTDTNSASDFSTHGILQDLQRIGDYLREFRFLKEDLESARSREEAESIIRSLMTLHEDLSAFPIALRVHKEIRELRERMGTLPLRQATAEEAARNRRIHEVQGNPPSCPKCGSKMNIQVGTAYVGWGCSEFPHCYGRRRATRKQTSYILGEAKTKPMNRMQKVPSEPAEAKVAKPQLIEHYIELRLQKRRLEQEIDSMKDQVLSEIISAGGSYKDSQVRIISIGRAVYRFSDAFYEADQRLKEQRRHEIENSIAEIEGYTEYLSVRFLS